MANHSRAKHLPGPGRSPTARRRLCVYDGRLWLRDFIWNEVTQQALAWNAARQFVGRLGSYKAAARAIGGLLARVYPFAKWLPMMHRDGWDGHNARSAMAFAWFVWEAGHRGRTEIQRIAWEPTPCG